MSAPAVIRLLLADGSADGFRVLDKWNWTGRCLVTSQADYARVRARDEWGRTGVYLLQGTQEGDARWTLHVGESDDVRSQLDTYARGQGLVDPRSRLHQHDGPPQQGPRPLLESRLIDLASRNGRVVLHNGTVPPRPPAVRGRPGRG